MNKNLIMIILPLLAVTILTFSLSFCERQEKEKNEPQKEEKVVGDDETEKGFTLSSKEGSLVAIVIGEDDSEVEKEEKELLVVENVQFNIAEAISFPSTNNKKDKAQYNKIRIDLPSGITDTVKFYFQKDDSDFEELQIKGNYIELPLANGKFAKLRAVTSGNKEEITTTSLIERSYNDKSGYLYKSIDQTIVCYVVPESSSEEYFFMTDDTNYKIDDYKSVNSALCVVSKEGKDTKGEVYSVVDGNFDIDYSSISWFLFKDDRFTMLPTVLSEEAEPSSVGACCDYAGDGLYVLMAKESKE